MIPGYIYVITNKINGKQYVGQTKRSLSRRFYEHTKETKYPSVIHKAIKKYGVENFEIKELECVDVLELDEREQYWIQKLDTYKNGYNQNFGGGKTGSYNQVKILENGLIIDSCESLARIISESTDFSFSFIKNKVRKIVNTEEDFYGFHLKSVQVSLDEVSDIQDIQAWVKSLPKSYSGKGIYCKELDQTFSTLGQAARYIVENNYYLGASDSEINSARAIISRCAHRHTTSPSLSNLSFEFTNITTKNNFTSAKNRFTKQKIYCPELDKEFESQISAAKYFVENNIWNVAQKTAKCRISEVICNIRQDYKGYHFEKVSNQEE